MATRSTIAVVNPDNSVSQIYCHWDGYPAHTGALLKEFYNTLEKAQELVSLGDLSFLAERLHPQGEHSFDAPETGCSVFCGRDRGETGTEPSDYWNLEMYLLSGDSREYDYLFKDGEWFLVWDKELQEF